MVFIVKVNLENVWIFFRARERERLAEARKYEGENMMDEWIKECKVQALSHYNVC